MSAELTMPALSPTMEKATLAKWLVKEGDVVAAGDMIAEIETDKATLEMEAPEAGTISKFLVTEGTEDVAVGAPIALFGAPVAPAAPPVVVEAPSESTLVVRAHLDFTAPSVAERKSPAEVKASPLARRIAMARGLDLATIPGSGARGKVMKADLGLPVRESTVVTPIAVMARPPPPLTDVPFETVKLSAMRKTIARRLTEAKQAVPHFYLGVDLTLDPLLAAREEMNAALAERDVKLSVNDFLIKALAIALEQAPDANVQFGGDELFRFSRVDVSMAVAVPGGLITPVIRDAGAKRLSHIAAESKDLAARARAGKLRPEEYQGGTVSISNLGMFGMRTITPVINPPQSLILGVGAAEARPVVLEREVVVATMLSVTASFDHRAIDGAVGAAFLQAFKRVVENPVQLFV